MAKHPSVSVQVEPVSGQEVAAVYVDVDALHPWEDNPRNNQPVAGVAKSIRLYGFGAPIVARKENGEIIAGHTRWKAAKSIGLKQVPVRYMDVDEATAHKMALADNRWGEEASWNEDARQKLLEEATVRDLDAMGFSAEDVLRSRADADDDEPDAVDDTEEKWLVLVVAASEEEQKELLARFEAEGLRTRALVG